MLGGYATHHHRAMADQAKEGFDLDPLRLPGKQPAVGYALIRHSRGPQSRMKSGAYQFLF